MGRPGFDPNAPTNVTCPCCCRAFAWLKHAVCRECRQKGFAHVAYFTSTASPCFLYRAHPYGRQPWSA